MQLEAARTCMYDTGLPCGDVHATDSRLGQGERVAEDLFLQPRRQKPTSLAPRRTNTYAFFALTLLLGAKGEMKTHT